MSALLCRNITLSSFDHQDQLMADAPFAAVKLPVAPPLPPQGGNFEFANWGLYRTFSDDQSSVSRLSAKSLELCTENLGSETGSDVATDCSGIFASSAAASAASSDRESSCTDDDQERSNSTAYKSKPRNDFEAMKPAGRRFPPPLTTMSGSNSLQVRRHREGGRLIIEAVETPFRSPYLQAERSGGRLRLCYLTDSDDSGPESPPPAPSPEAEEDPRNEIEPGVEEVEGEMNMERFQRWSRCKERRHENEGLCNNWKPAFWVATS